MNGRNISDAIRGLYDTINSSKHRNISGIMLAVDFSKAFGSMEFSFIEAVLKIVNFSDMLIAWIQIILKDLTIILIHYGKGWTKGGDAGRETQ